MDDNFASIVGAIEEGRTMFDNLKKSIAYTIAHTVPELIPILLNIWFSLPLAMPGLALLTIDLLSEQGPAVSFAYEKAEDSIMARPPRKMGVDKLVSLKIIFYSYVTSGFASALTCIFAFLMVYVRAGIPVSALWNVASQNVFRDPSIPSDDPVTAATFGTSNLYSPAQQWAIYTQSVSAYCVRSAGEVGFGGAHTLTPPPPHPSRPSTDATVIANQFFHVWVCKTRVVSVFTHGLFGNLITIWGGVFALFIAAFFVYIPGVQAIFFTGTLDGALWTCSIAYGAYILLYTEGAKWQLRKNPEGFVAKWLAW
jgi:sodium/potassium-transporting ATPase subunit alpha